MENFTDFLFEKKTFLFLVAVVSAYYLLRRDPRIKFHFEKLKGPASFPVLGNALQLARPHNEIISTFGSWLKEYGTICRFWIGNFAPYVLTCDVQVFEKILSGQAYIEKGKYEYSLVLDWLGTGLLSAPASKWSSRRKMLTPAFHFKILEDFIPVFNEQASILVECLERDVRGNQEIFDIYPYIAKCTLDIICETAMGYKLSCQSSSRNKEYFDAVCGMCEIIMEKFFKPWLRLPVLYHLSSISRNEKRCLGILKGLSKKVIQTRKAERNSKLKSNCQSEDNVNSEEQNVYGRKRKAFLDVLLDVDNPPLSDEDIREEVDTFMFEGHDTTSVNLSWTLLLLAMFPEQQQLVHKELDEIFSEDNDRDVTAEDIAKLKFLECCIKESLRLFPSAPFITRQIRTDLCLENGILLPKGSTAMMSLYHVHRLPEHFPNPDKFIPERWLPEREGFKKRHPYAFIPFSAGPRNCIGQKFAMLEEKVILAKLLRKYSVETRLKLEQVKIVPDVVLRCENGVKISLRKRY